MDDKQLLRRAIALSVENVAAGGGPFGAVVARGGEIVAEGVNRVTTLHDPTAHAEMQAITMATDALGGKYLADCTLYVTVEPCPMCAAALAWAQIPRIVYGAADPKRGYSLFSPSLLHPRTTVTCGILADECSTLMKEFFKERR